MSDDEIVRVPEGRVVRDFDDLEGIALDAALYGDVYRRPQPGEAEWLRLRKSDIYPVRRWLGK